MVSKSPRDYAEAIPAYGEPPRKPEGPCLGTLRIAKITYDHTPIHQSKDGGSIGQMVDAQIAATIEKGEMISEVSLFFETQEMQHAIAEMYRVPTAEKAY